MDFEDIERGDQLTDEKGAPNLRRKETQHPEVFHAKQSYYQWARSKLNDGRFESQKDQLIWEYHAEGLSRRQISPRIGLEGSWVTRKIKRIENYLTIQAKLLLGSVSFSQGIA